jgi:uncharacterized caspase-like protein
MRLRVLLLVLLATLGLGSCSTGPAPGASGRVALVIGNAAYTHAPPLANPLNDASDVCAVLRRLRFTVLCHLDVADRATLDRHVRDYVERLEAGSVGLIYYAGHGVQVGQANYLIPVRADPAALRGRATDVLYGLDELFDRLRRKTPLFQLVVLDACRSDLSATAPAGPAAPSPGGLSRALQGLGSTSTGLSAIRDAPAGTMVLYATASGSAAFDGAGRNGPLTKHLLQHIGTRGIAVEEFLKRVTAGVEADTGSNYARRQTPFVYGSFSGRFCFAGCPGEREIVPAF